VPTASSTAIRDALASPSTPKSKAVFEAIMHPRVVERTLYYRENAHLAKKFRR
jgi:hypothetical protein